MQGFHGSLPERRTSVHLAEDGKCGHEIFREFYWQYRRSIGYLQIACHTYWLVGRAGRLRGGRACGWCAGSYVLQQCRQGGCVWLRGSLGGADFWNLNHRASATNSPSREQKLASPHKERAAKVFLPKVPDKSC